jgi:hypothetical protein
MMPDERMQFLLLRRSPQNRATAGGAQQSAPQGAAEPPMLEYLLPVVAVVFIAVGLFGLYSSRQLGRSRKQTQEHLGEENVKVLADWQPSGRIDFSCPDDVFDEDKPGAFTLRVEEYRTLQGPSGTTRVELRWRDATLAEAKRVVVHYNRHRNIHFEGSLVPSPSVIPQIDVAEANEGSDGRSVVKQ